MDPTLLRRLGAVSVEADFRSFGVVDISSSVEYVLGYSVDECCRPGFLLERLIHPDDVESVAARLMELFETGHLDVKFRAVRRDGSPVNLQALLATCGEDDVPHFAGILLEQSRSPQTAHVVEERLRLALDSADMGVWDWNLSQWTIFWSDQVYRLHGTTREELGDLFESYDELVDRIHPDDLSTVQQIVMRAIRSGENYDVEYRVEQPDGTYRWLNVKGRIYFDENDQPARIAGTVQDSTARKTAEISARRELAERIRAEAELKQLNETLEERVSDRTRDLERANEQLKREVSERARAEAQLARVNRRLIQSNRELEDFAHVASHDLREPLRKITTFADLLQSDYGRELAGEGRYLVERMQYSAHRMMQLIDDLLRFSRVSTGGESFARIDLNDVVREAMADLEVRIEEEAASVRVGDMPSIDADPTQIRQLFQNLISNALKFRREDVPPVIEIRTAIVNGNHAVDGSACRVIVEDNGIGLDEQYADRIFAPFQRLRREYEGTGMGLAICRRIVERHHGTISVSSAPGEGARFIIHLPLRQPVSPEGASDLNDRLS